MKKGLREKIFERDNYTCKECGSKEKLTLDHVIARSKGGSDGEHNLQVLCEPCNLKKANSGPKLIRNVGGRTFVDFKNIY